jgi:hypothetical protein
MSSFMDIKDPWERDATIKDYLTTMKRIQERNEEEKTSGLYRQRELEHHFAPVVQIQDKMSKEIIEGLKPIKEEVTTLRENLENRDEALPRKMRRVDMDEYGPLAREFRTRYTGRDPDVDTTFGIKYLLDGRSVIGNTPITISDDDIMIYGEVYDGTPGLWSLLTETEKDKLTKDKWNQDDMNTYAEILRQTSVLHEDYNPNNPHPRSNRSWKWKHILGKLWDQLKQVDEEYGGTGLLPRHPVRGCRVYLHNNGHCYMVQTTKSGKGLHLSPHPPIGVGNGLYLKAGSTLYDGHGLLLGPNSPFKSIPILGLLL